jgi:exosortase
LALAAVVWSYWSSLVETAERWWADPQYTHGWVVPAFSVYLLYHRRDLLPNAWFHPRWWGLAVAAGSVVLRGLSVALYQPWLDMLSLLVCLVGLCVTLGGLPLLRWAWLAILFLGFMIPLPYRLQSALGTQLQGVATAASTYLLQTVGVPAVSEGNVILLSNPPPLGVAEACSGLGMLVMFVALSAGFAILASRSWPYRIALLVAALPIAVAANVLRITVTGILYETNQHDLARKVYHDVAGYLMPIVGSAMLAALMFVIDRSVRRPATK